VNELIILIFPPSTSITYTIAMYDPPSSSFLYTIHLIILVITISCKGQRVRGQG